MINEANTMVEFPLDRSTSTLQNNINNLSLSQETRQNNNSNATRSDNQLNISSNFSPFKNNNSDNNSSNPTVTTPQNLSFEKSNDISVNNASDDSFEASKFYELLNQEEQEGQQSQNNLNWDRSLNSSRFGPLGIDKSNNSNGSNNQNSQRSVSVTSTPMNSNSFSGSTRLGRNPLQSTAWAPKDGFHNDFSMNSGVRMKNIGSNGGLHTTDDINIGTTHYNKPTERAMFSSESSIWNSSPIPSLSLQQQQPQQQQQQKQSQTQMGFHRQATSLTSSPTLWATTPGSVEDTPVHSRMSRFFPSPVTEQHKDFELGSRSQSNEYPNSPLNFGLFGGGAAAAASNSLGLNTPSLLDNQFPHRVPLSSHSQISTAGSVTPITLSGKRTSAVDPLFDSFSLSSIPPPPPPALNSLLPHSSELSVSKEYDEPVEQQPIEAGKEKAEEEKKEEQEQEESFRIFSEEEMKEWKRIRDNPTKLIVRTVSSDDIAAVSKHDEILDSDISLPSPLKFKGKKIKPVGAKVSKYIKNIIIRQPIQYSIYIASLPFDTPTEQCHLLIDQAFKNFGEITKFTKDEHSKSSKVTAENDLFIRFRIVAKLFNDQRVPYKSHRFYNDSTGRDSKMLLFFDCTTSNPNSSTHNESGSSSSSSKQDISTCPEGFSSTFHRRGVNNFMFVRELQSKMIVNKIRGSGGSIISETGEFRISLPIEELNLGSSRDLVQHDYHSDYDHDSSEMVKRFKRSYIVNVDVRELESKPNNHGYSNNNSASNGGNGNGNGHSHNSRRNDNKSEGGGKKYYYGRTSISQTFNNKK